MTWWSEKILPPLAQSIGKITALFPFSLGELVVILGVLGLVFYSLFRIYQFFRKGKPLYSLFALLLSLCLWLWAGMSWLWNPLYYVPTLASRMDLDTSPYPVEDLALVTLYFAQTTADFSVQVTRDENLRFAVPQEEYFPQALALYEDLGEEYSFLAMENVRAKSLSLSYLQSQFGFTGVYNPFTGEANINVHTPPVLHPATIAHEMAHQRMIAPEAEANFLCVLACLDTDNPTYQYSGALFGLIQLSNALYPVEGALWQEIIQHYFTPEMTTDWQENYEYWQALQSPVEDVAKEVYDGFLKGNDQELGIRSYGACVDLLVAYYLEDATLWLESTISPQNQNN